MNVMLLSLLFLADPQVDSVEVRAVLEWNVTEPPPLSAETIERVVTEALSRAEPFPESTRRELLLRRGIVAFNGTDVQLEQAVRDLTECHQLAPDDFVIDSYRIAAQASAGLQPSTGPALRKDVEALVVKHPESPLPRWALAILLDQYRKRDYARILKLLDECHELDSKFVPAYATKVYIHLILHDYDACLDAVKLVRDCPPGNDPRSKVTIESYGAIAHIWEGRSAVALPILVETVNLIPDRGTPRFILWIALSCLGRDASAEVVADQLMEHLPKLRFGYFTKALSLSLRGEQMQAREIADKINELRITTGPDYLKPILAGRLAEREGKLKAAIAAYRQAMTEIDKTVDAPIFSIDVRLRLALLLCAAPDKSLRDGFKSVRLARTLVEELEDSPAHRMALLVLACGHAEKGDFADAIEVVDEAAGATDISEAQAAQCKKLKDLFQRKSPFRMAANDPAERIIEIPAVACYFGPFKKISLNATPTLTIPDE